MLLLLQFDLTINYSIFMLIVVILVIFATLSSDDVKKVGFLRELSGAKERLKILKADLLVEGSFDEAVLRVDSVFHTASPVLVPYDDNVQVCYLHLCTKELLLSPLLGASSN